MLKSQLGSNKAYRTVLLVNNLLIYIYKKETKVGKYKGFGGEIFVFIILV